MNKEKAELCKIYDIFSNELYKIDIKSSILPDKKLIYKLVESLEQFNIGILCDNKNIIINKKL
jgi:hypothetical protein